MSYKSIHGHGVIKFFVVTLLINALYFQPYAGQSAAVNAVPGQAIGIEQELNRAFKRYELLKIDSRRAMQQVGQSGRLSLVTSGRALNLTLQPHDMRAPNYRATKIGADGVPHPLDAGFVHTFKGKVDGVENSHARLTIDERHIEGMIIIEGERYYIEPARTFFASAAPADFVFYKSSDLIQNSSDACSVIVSKKVNAASDGAGSLTSTTFSPFRVVELATDADHEYVSALGGPANALNEISSIMNQVEGIYETELGITFQIVFQNAWETANDPYTSTGDSFQILNEFKDYWNTHFTGVSRDVAHMWTGKNMGGTLGRSWQGVACSNPSFSYGISRFDDRLPLKYNTPAHEIAHNLGASHADGISDCVGSIMRPTTTSGLTFCEYSRSEITQYIEQSGRCLTSAATLTISGQVTEINGRPLNNVEVKLSGTQSLTVLSDNEGRFSFNNLVPGHNYVVTPSKANYTFSPQGQTFNNLSSDQTIYFTVTSSSEGPILVTEPDSNRAVALDSVTFLRDPFPIVSSHNFSTDRRTRVMFLMVNVNLLPGEDVSVVKAQAEDSRGKVYSLQVESLEKVPGFDWLTQIVVKLPDELANAGDLFVSVNLRGALSNKALISIAPSGNASP